MGAQQKVAIITGASQGIGAGLVAAYRERNFRVVANSRAIRQPSDPEILAVAGDVADPGTAERIVSQALERFGRVDTLVNNAGIFISKPFTDHTDEDYARMLAINLSGFFYVTRRAAGQMLKQGSGHIVQITTSLDENASSRVPSRPWNASMNATRMPPAPALCTTSPAGAPSLPAPARLRSKWCATSFCRSSRA